MTYSASIERLCDHAMILRVHVGEGGVYGDPYVWSVFVACQGPVAEFKGVLAAPPLGATWAIAEALRAAGFTRRVHDRIRSGVTERISRRI